MTRDRNVADYLRMSEAMFYVLLALADGDKHGYSIMKDVAERTNDSLVLSTGTLYGIIKRLLAEGLIVEVRVRSSAETRARKRRAYALTAFGREVAKAEAARLKSLVAAARGVSLIPRTS